MKKLFTTMFSLALIISLSVLASCGGAPSKASVDKVIEKYDASEELTESDYSVLIDYISAAMDDALPLAKEMKKAYENDDYDKIEKLQKKAEKIEEKYPDMEDALSIIQRADDDELGTKNVEKAKKLLRKMTDIY